MLGTSVPRILSAAAALLLAACDIPISLTPAPPGSYGGEPQYTGSNIQLAFVGVPREKVDLSRQRYETDANVAIGDSVSLFLVHGDFTSTIEGKIVDTIRVATIKLTTWSWLNSTSPVDEGLASVHQREGGRIVIVAHKPARSILVSAIINGERFDYRPVFSCTPDVCMRVILRIPDPA